MNWFIELCFLFVFFTRSVSNDQSSYLQDFPKESVVFFRSLIIWIIILCSPLEFGLFFNVNLIEAILIVFIFDEHLTNKSNNKVINNKINRQI